jgi:REP element-mobilizing transposase RayT
MTPKAGSHRLRTGRYSQAGQVYLLTMVTLNRKQVFAEFQSARCLVRTLHEESRLGRANTWAYVVMPDHLHWLMQLGEQVDLGRCVGASPCPRISVLSHSAHSAAGAASHRGSMHQFQDGHLREEGALWERAPAREYRF